MKLRLGFVSNSSSEAFLIAGGKTPAQIEDDLRAMLEVYNTITGCHLEFDGVFKTPRHPNEGDYSHLATYCSDSWVKGELTRARANSKTVIIYSSDDNSIPWGIMEFIEGVYDDVDRIHLG